LFQQYVGLTAHFTHYWDLIFLHSLGLVVTIQILVDHLSQKIVYHHNCTRLIEISTFKTA
jgi:hypothetical protein